MIKDIMLTRMFGQVTLKKWYTVAAMKEVQNGLSDQALQQSESKYLAPFLKYL